MNIAVRTTLFATILGALLGPLAAGAQPVADTVQSILQSQHTLRDRIDQRGGEYSRYSETALDHIRRQQDRVFFILGGKASLDDLNYGQKMDLSNALDDIKATLAENADNRLICHPERQTGSNLIKRVCLTAAERQALYDATQHTLRDSERIPSTATTP